MGVREPGPVRLSFNRQLRVEFRGATVSSDAGLLVPRELDERLGLNTFIERHLDRTAQTKAGSTPVGASLRCVLAGDTVSEHTAVGADGPRKLPVSLIVNGQKGLAGVR